MSFPQNHDHDSIITTQRDSFHPHQDSEILTNNKSNGMLGGGVLFNTVIINQSDITRLILTLVLPPFKASGIHDIVQV